MHIFSLVFANRVPTLVPAAPRPLFALHPHHNFTHMKREASRVQLACKALRV